MTIAFVHDHKAFLPALTHYPRFFSNFGISCEVVTRSTLARLQRDVDWFFMGTDHTRHRDSVYKIHEYISPSVPPFRLLKDRFKAKFNTQPDLRIFKNEYVRNHFNFRDNIAFCYQDIGIETDEIITKNSAEKEFDFIYIGDISKHRHPEDFLDMFVAPALSEKSILVLSNNYSVLQSKYRHASNIIFKGPVDKAAVKTYLYRSKFGINYIPDIEPFNRLTSTKLLEYAAVNLPIISTRYEWVETFQKKYGGKFFYLDQNLSNLTWEKLQEFEFKSPDLSQWTWEAQIRSSGVLDFLCARFPGLHF